jgi:hypothetical protein
MKKLSALLLSTLLILATNRAEASIYGGLNLFYWQSTIDNGTSQSTVTYTLPGITVGWYGTTPLFLGLTYNSWSVTSSNSPGTTTTQTLTDYGPTVGYLAPNWHLLATYLYSATYTVNSGGSSITYTGNGFEVQLGYRFSLGSNVSLGPSLIYTTRTYTQMTSPANQALNPSQKRTDLLPFLNLALEFK